MFQKIKKYISIYYSNSVIRLSLDFVNIGIFKFLCNFSKIHPRFKNHVKHPIFQKEFFSRDETYAFRKNHLDINPPFSNFISTSEIEIFLRS